jgi:dihydropyrimidine dehydrogenase (NAD+) subunit PreA
MVDITANCAGITSPNPFWLASAPPTNSGDQIKRAFDAGWGGAVWKTLGEPIRNVSSRYGGLDRLDRRLVGLNNVELITDRSLEVNFAEIADVKRQYPDHAVIASLMVETREQWKDIVKRSIDAGADGLELNFGCPHGMCERGMGSAVGQEPKVNAEITSWVMDYSSIPVLVKLTPNVSDILPHGLAAQRGGANGVSLINTIKSVIGVDIDRFVPNPRIGNRSTNGGYCGPAVKPIALHMIGSLARANDFKLPISGIGGIATWHDVVEFILMGCTSVQVCTAVMHHGYRIVEAMTDGLVDYMEDKGFDKLDDFVGKAIPNFGEWGELDLNYKVVARIDPETCIGCQKCYIACYDGSHQSIDVPEQNHEGMDFRVPVVREDDCVGCNLCNLICPVPGCIDMVEVDTGEEKLTYRELQDGAAAKA